MTRTPALLMTLMIAMPFVAAAQPSATLTVGQSKDRYDSGATGDAAERNVAMGGTVEQRFAGGRGRAFYDADFATYAAEGDWRSLQHEFGASWRVDLGSDARRLFAGSSGVVRRNGEAWGAADYSGANAFVNLEDRTRGTITLRGGYRLDVRRFDGAEYLDQTQHGVFGSVLVNLATRTTLIAEVSGGMKDYAGGAVSAAPATPDAAGVPASAGAAAAGSGSGGGQGIIARDGVGRDDGANAVAAHASTGTRAGQVTVFGRVAQSLAARTGLTFEASHRSTFGDLAPALVNTPPGFFDDGVYDDPFTSDSTLARVGVKSVLSRGVVLNASASWQDKPYRATPALNEDGTAMAGVLRHDHVVRGSFSATWPLLSDRTGAVALDLMAGYDYTQHQSTTAVYNYRSHGIGLGLTVGY